MSLENAILENTAALKELIALLKTSKAVPAVQTPAPAAVPAKVETEVPTRAFVVTVLNKAIEEKGKEAVRAIFNRFGKDRLSDFESAQLGDLIAALEA